LFDEEDEAMSKAIYPLKLPVSIKNDAGRTVAEKALPFDPLVPNKTTIEALTAARRGHLKKADTIDALIADLNAND
jgi:antitoxin component of RelBE/YafQ-DinJ toxin-antitoxin module